MTSKTHPKFTPDLLPEENIILYERFQMETRVVTTAKVVHKHHRLSGTEGKGCSIRNPMDKDDDIIGETIAAGRAVKDWWERRQVRTSAVKLSFRDHPLPVGPPDGLSFAPVG